MAADPARLGGLRAARSCCCSRCRSASTPRTPPCASGSARCSAPSPRPSSAPRPSARTGSPSARSAGSTRRSRATRARDGAGAEPRRASCSPAACSSPTSCWRVVVVAGTYLGVAGEMTVGRLLAFLFLVQLFTGPVQMATEILNELQNAVAGLAPGARRPRDAGRGGRRRARTACPARAARRTSSCAAVGLRLPGRPAGAARRRPRDPRRARRSPSSARPARARRRSPSSSRGSWTPPAGRCCSTAWTCATSPSPSLRRRVVLVPQEGFLFDGTLAREHRVRPARRGRRRPRRRTTTRGSARRIDALGLDGWVDELADGLDTPVGQRGESLSAGERQLVALARAYLAERRPAGARRGDVGGRPGDRGPHRPRARLAHARAAAP